MSVNTFQRGEQDAAVVDLLAQQLDKRPSAGILITVIDPADPEAQQAMMFAFSTNVGPVSILRGIRHMLGELAATLFDDEPESLKVKEAITSIAALLGTEPERLGEDPF